MSTKTLNIFKTGFRHLFNIFFIYDFNRKIMKSPFYLKHYLSMKGDNKKEVLQNCQNSRI